MHELLLYIIITFSVTLAEMYRIWISGLQYGRSQHILNKPDWIQATISLKFPKKDQDFQNFFFGI